MFVIILFLHPMSTCTYWQAVQQDVFVLQAASEYRSLHINLEAWWRIYVSSNWVITGSGNGLTPARRKVITWSQKYLAIVNWTLEDKLDWNLNQNAKRFFRKNAFEISPAKAILFWLQCGFMVYVVAAAVAPTFESTPRVIVVVKTRLTLHET